MSGSQFAVLDVDGYGRVGLVDLLRHLVPRDDTPPGVDEHRADPQSRADPDERPRTGDRAGAGDLDHKSGVRRQCERRGSDGQCRSLVVDPEGQVRTVAVSAISTTPNDVIVLDEVAKVLCFGTLGLNRT